MRTRRFRGSQLDACCGARALTSPATIMIRPSSLTFRNGSGMGTASSSTVPVMISAIPAGLVAWGRAGPARTRRFRHSQLDARCRARALTSPATIMIRPSSFTFRNGSEMGTASSTVPVMISAIPASLVGSGRAGPSNTRRLAGGWRASCRPNQASDTYRPTPNLQRLACGPWCRWCP